MILGKIAIKSIIAIGLIRYLILPFKPLYFEIFPQKINLSIYSTLNIKKKT